MVDIKPSQTFVARIGPEARTAARNASFWHVLAQFATLSRRLGDVGPSPAPGKFGAAHWRALAAISGWPGGTVSGLIHRLGITKQSLSPVLKDLTDGGFVLVRPGTYDRRRREIYPTEAGLHAWRAAADEHARLLESALAAAGDDAAKGFLKTTRILATLMNEAK